MPGTPGGELPRPRKRFGQHFLADPRALDRLVEALSPTAADTVVEIGPGRGALTDRLVERCRRLVAVEIDRDLVRHLRDRYAGRAVEIIEGDALVADWGAVAGRDFLLAGNLPYYITTPLIFRILEPPQPRRAVVLVQREVADRMTAPAGSEAYGALSVNVQVSALVEQAGRVSAGAFHPRPAVDSAIVRLTPIERPAVPPDAIGSFRRFVQAAFGMRRKQLKRVIRELWLPDAHAAAAVLASLELSATARPETLAPADYVRLFETLGS